MRKDKLYVDDVTRPHNIINCNGNCEIKISRMFSSFVKEKKNLTIVMKKKMRKMRELDMKIVVKFQGMMECKRCHGNVI